jgi:hypothetical protein
MTIPNHPKDFTMLCLRRRRAFHAFTLVEILLVVSLFAVTSLAIFQTFSSGVKIWDYASKFFPEEDVLLSFERITHDLHNAFYFSLFEFKGEANVLQFTTIITTKADLKSGATDSYVQQIGKVQYKFDKGKRQFLRQQADYSEAIRQQWQTTRVLAEGIDQLNFSYLYRDKDRLVERAQAQGVMPAMVKIEIHYQADKEIRRMTRLIDLPSSLSDL